jgi:hypothetical protein
VLRLILKRHKLWANLQGDLKFEVMPWKECSVMDERLQFHPCIRAGPELNGGLGGLEPPTSLLSVVTKPSATDCDGLRSCWFSAPVQAIRTLAALLSIVTVLDLGGHKIGHSGKEHPPRSAIVGPGIGSGPSYARSPRQPFGYGSPDCSSAGIGRCSKIFPLFPQHGSSARLSTTPRNSARASGVGWQST